MKTKLQKQNKFSLIISIFLFILHFSTTTTLPLLLLLFQIQFYHKYTPKTKHFPVTVISNVKLFLQQNKQTNK